LSLTGNLVTADADNSPDQLTYTVKSLPANGVLSREGVALEVGGTFTQQDITDGKVSYANNGDEAHTDEFTWELSDGANKIPANGATPFAITVNPVNDTPTIVNNPTSTVAEGGTEILSTARLMAADAENEQLTYTLLAVTHGQVQLNNVAVAINGTFTQQDVDAGNVKFVDSGVDDAMLQQQLNTTASFSWKVTDAEGGVNPATGSNVSTFTITSVDDLPTVNWKTTRCAAGSGTTLVTATPFLSLSDPDNTITQYQVCITGIGSGHTYAATTGGGGVDDTSVANTVQNGAAIVTTGACFPANAISALTMKGNGNVTRGSISWKLMKGTAQVGTGMGVGFPTTNPPAPFTPPTGC
jgi:hypothetical protein